MRQALVLLLGSLLLAGCTNSTVGAGFGVTTGDPDYSSTEAYDVKVVQTANPMSFPNADNGRIDVSFDIEFTNKSEKPVTITRISLQSMGGTQYRLETSTRKYERLVAPHEKTTFKYWAPAIVDGTALDARAPMVVRTLIDTLVDGQDSRETFNREVNGGWVIGVRSGRT